MSSATPTVSVIVPNYNHARFLPKRIESILGQTYQDFELILLDDCSEDESRSVLSAYAADARVRVEFNGANSGTPFKQWNKGVRMAQGKYVWIAESDDYADEGLLEHLVKLLETDEGVAYAYCRSWRTDENGEVDGLIDAFDPPDLARWSRDFCSEGVDACRLYFVQTNIVANASAVVFRKSVYEAVGGADETLRLCGDWKLWAAMALRGKIGYVSEPLNYYRFHGGSVRSGTGSDGRGVAEAIRVVRWIMSNVTPVEAVRERFCEISTQMWMEAIGSWQVPLRRKWEILRDITAVDRHAFRRAADFLKMKTRQKLGERWHDIRDRVKEGYASR